MADRHADLLSVRNRLIVRLTTERDEVRAALAQRDAEIERLRQLSVINDPKAAWDTETARLHAELAEVRRVIATALTAVEASDLVSAGAILRAALPSGDGTREQ